MRTLSAALRNFQNNVTFRLVVACIKLLSRSLISFIPHSSHFTLPSRQSQEQSVSHRIHCHVTFFAFCQLKIHASRRSGCFFSFSQVIGSHSSNASPHAAMFPPKTMRTQNNAHPKQCAPKNKENRDTPNHAIACSEDK
jgi:hypothetical protein